MDVRLEKERRVKMRVGRRREEGWKLGRLKKEGCRRKVEEKG